MKFSDFFRQLNIFFFALLAGQIFFAFVSVINVVILKNAFAANGLSEIFAFLIPVYAFSVVLAGSFIFKKRLAGIDRKETNARFEIYRSAFIVRLALIESSSFISFVAYLMSGDWIYLAFGLLIVVLFLFLRPLKEKVQSDMELSSEEKE